VLSADTFAMVDFSEEGIAQTIFICATYSKPEKVMLSVLGNGPENWKTFIFF